MPLFETTIHADGTSRRLIKVHAIRALVEEFSEIDAKTLANRTRPGFALVRSQFLEFSINQRKQALAES